MPNSQKKLADMDTLANIFGESDKLTPATQIIEEHAQAMPNASVINGLRLYTVAKLMEQNFPEEQWVIDDLIPEGVTVMSAAPASFKTWLLLSIAASVACGTDLFGHFKPRQAGVLMIDEEDNPRLLQKRLRMLGVPTDAPIHLMIGQGFKINATQVTKVIEFCENNDVGLVTIDSLVRVHNAKENDAVEMSEVFATLRRFHKAGINVLLTHHNRKGKSENAGEDMRGSSDIFAAVDCNLAISRSGDDLVMKQVKLRTAQEIGDVGLEVEANEDSLVLKFLGITGPSRSKQAEAIDQIQHILSTVNEANQMSLHKSLEDVDLKISIKTLRAALKKMATHKIIIEERGKGNELLYRLNNQ